MEGECIGLFHDNAEYDAFVNKFKPKKTTDDCYTPPLVYDAVADWVAKEYGLDRSAFVRPFYPGGNFEAECYGENTVVVDNPPFSILSHIVRFYTARRVRFFLFAPALTLFAATECKIAYIPCGVSVIYENGANVATSFCTNLDTCAVRTAPTLYEAVKLANDETQKRVKISLPKYVYPDAVITAAAVQRLCKHGVEFRVDHAECIYISALDAQRDEKKSIFGGGFLLKPRAAAERAAAERVAAERVAAERAAAERVAATEWALSDRERALLGMEPSGDLRQTTLFDMVPELDTGRSEL